MHNKNLIINKELVQHLVATQFPQWKDLLIRPVNPSGWDNRTFRIGEHMLVRMPTAEEYAAQVAKEHLWLPKLAPLLSLTIPTPLALGQLTDTYPWNWSIYNWLKGESATSANITNLSDFAFSLAQFLISLHHIDTTDGPLPGPHNFYRGGTLMTYDAETRQAIAALEDKIDTNAATRIWKAALATSWHQSPVWVHGDISVGNLLVQDGKLSSVIDFGMLAVGDPACDLVITWTLFKGESRKQFKKALPYDDGTWDRARAWALWKALIVAAGFSGTNATESTQSLLTLDEILSEQ